MCAWVVDIWGSYGHMRVGVTSVRVYGHVRVLRPERAQRYGQLIQDV